MAASLQDYKEALGPRVMKELMALADRLQGRRVQNINSTLVGGGVAEILSRMIPLLRELGVDAVWNVIQGDPAFFNATKAFHNALHGEAQQINQEMFETFRETTERNLRDVNLTGDHIIIHDPQPAGLVLRKGEAGGRWTWRCHIDVSSPDPRVWSFLKTYVEQYDASVFSMPEFARQLTIQQFLVAPSIDPLSDKNRELEPACIARILEKYRLDPQRPILTQISRFDRLKDPLGVVAAYRLAKQQQDCQLVLAGGGAPDDPEGDEVLREVEQAAANDPDIHVLPLPPGSDLEINALVRGSTVVMQKSIKEGFGLTVSEALWKRKPVIGGAVGGIKRQILDGVTGFLVKSPEEAARRAVQLLGDGELRRRMGENGYRHVKQNFLLTRQVKDCLMVMLALEHPGEEIVRFQAA